MIYAPLKGAKPKAPVFQALIYRPRVYTDYNDMFTDPEETMVKALAAAGSVTAFSDGLALAALLKTF